MPIARRRLILAPVLAVPVASGAKAGPLRPRVVTVRLDAGLEDRRFLAPALRRIREVLAPPVDTVEVRLDLSGLPRSGGLLLGEPLVRRVVGGIDWAGLSDTVQVVLFADDMRAPPANFNFALTVGTAESPVRLVLVSLARLGGSRLPEVVGARVARMVVKNVARSVGYAGSERCVFAFPRSLGELDAMPEGFCEPDLTALREAGIAR